MSEQVDETRGKNTPEVHDPATTGPRLGDSSSGGSGSPQDRPPVSPRKVLKFGTVTVALGTVAQIIGHIETIRKFVVDLIGIKAFKNLHVLVSVIVVVVLIVGYGAAAYWIYLQIQHRGLRAKIIIVGLSVIFMIGLAAGSYALIPPAPDVYKYQAQKVKEWSDNLLRNPTKSGGVAVSFSDAQAPPQVWTTAQVLRAVLVSGVDLTPLSTRIQRAFDYIEHARIKTSGDGWGYFEDWPTGVTEAAGWVCVAQIASLDARRRDTVWPEDRVNEITQRTKRLIDLLVSIQQDDGGWGPTADRSSAGQSRTYSTAMATWCLIELYRNDLPSVIDKESYERAAQKALTWLFLNYQRGLGWVPNPTRRGQNETFLGLSAQVLYLVTLAQETPNFRFAANLPNAALARSEFLDLSDFEQRKLGTNDRLHDSDRYVTSRIAQPASAPTPCISHPFTIEASTFLWFPWSLAASRALAKDQAISQEQRAKAAKVSEVLAARLSEATPLIDTGLNYIMAEFLIGVSQRDPRDRATKR